MTLSSVLADQAVAQLGYWLEADWPMSESEASIARASTTDHAVPQRSRSCSHATSVPAG